MKMEMLLVLLLFTCHESSTTAASTTDRNTNFRIASAGCKEQCGNVRIPFPFGIDIGPNPNCSYDEWFRIDCINDSKPILTKAKLEVLDISTNGTLLVNSPITFFCDEQTDGSSKPVTDLKGSPFVYSRSENVFTALSCDYFASVRSNDTAHPVIAGGCTSACDKDTSELNCDIGVNCCRTSIPPYLTSIVAQANFFNESDILNDCSKFAFLVEKDWFEENSNYASTVSGFKADMKKKRKVPVALDWRINNDTRSFNSFHNFTVNRSLYEQDVRGGFYNNLTTFRYPCNPSCYITTLRNRSEIVCSCILGFEGNPYLFSDIDDPYSSHICVDIDECKDDRYYPQCYGRNNKCVNDYGGYHCKHDKRKAPNKRKAHDKRKAKLILATGLSSSLGLLMLLIGAWFGYKFLKKRNEIKRKKMFFKRNGGLLLEQELSSGKVDVEQIKLFKSEELEKSTDNFNTDRILGQGGQGTVYKGMLKDGKIVAVKKSKMVDESQLSEFINEVVILSQLNHRNIVKLLGCCLETEVPLLVYEFIPNGTLSQYITKQIEEFPLTWKMRLRIATEIAGALSHLHYTASFPIYHRDIKSTNILLDEKYRAKVADFGTSRSIAIDQTHLTTSLVHGTFGYLDPEYFQSSQFTEKSDVYSFGVVLVELLTGQKPISFLRSEDEGRSLATYFLISMQKDRLFEIVDAQVLKDGPKEDITAVANLARRCLNLNGRERPTMREVTTELEVIQKTRKGVEGEEPHEEVEYLRNDSVEPWDITSSSSATVAGPVSTNADIPLLYFKSL